MRALKSKIVRREWRRALDKTYEAGGEKLRAQLQRSFRRRKVLPEDTDRSCEPHGSEDQVFGRSRNDGLPRKEKLTRRSNSRPTHPLTATMYGQDPKPASLPNRWTFKCGNSLLRIPDPSVSGVPDALGPSKDHESASGVHDLRASAFREAGVPESAELELEVLRGETARRQKSQRLIDMTKEILYHLGRADSAHARPTRELGIKLNQKRTPVSHPGTT